MSRATEATNGAEPHPLAIGEPPASAPETAGSPASDRPASVWSIVLNWNRRDDTLACLKSLSAMTGGGAAFRQQILLVDNGSTDGTPAAVRTAFPAVEVLALPANLGFAAGMNQGIRHALARGADWTLLVNNDAVAEPELLDRLLAAGGNPAVGFLAPTIRYFETPERVWPSAGRRRRLTLAAFDTTAHPPSSQPYPIDWATACCLLVRREAWLAVGLFDERFGMYYEDHDLCLRARAAGWELRHVPAARIRHKVARSTGPGSPAQRYHLGKSSVLYFAKHSRGLQRALILPYRAGSLLRSLARSLAEGRPDAGLAHLRGIAAGLAALRAEPPAAPAAIDAIAASADGGAGDSASDSAGDATAARRAARHVPTPDRREIEAYLRQVRILEDPVDGRALIDARQEIDAYVTLHARSAELSLAMLARHLPPGRRLRVLELGGAPYFFSALLQRSFEVELTAANVQAGAWPGEAGPLEHARVTLAVPEPPGRLAIDVRVFNIEKDPFPFADASFDLVLCMEVLEHLAYSPSHMLAEAHRVLAPGGLFFLTVPNFINLKRTVNLLLNRRTEYPYSGYGVYGRHAREYAPFEVRDLLEACRYRVAELATANVWPTFRDSRGKGLGNAALNALGRLPLPWLEAKREYILCAARPYGAPLAAYPDWLYTHRHLYPDPPHGVEKRLLP